MRHDADRRLPRPLLGEILHGGDAVILFDVEAVFIFPWAVILRQLKAQGEGHFGLWEMFVYIGIFLVGFFYVWKKGVLDWGLRSSRERGDV